MVYAYCMLGRLCMKCDGTRAETRFHLSAKRMSPFKSAGASVQSTTGSRAVHISLQGLYCSCKPVFCSHVTLTGYPLHSLASPSLLLPCVTVCHHISIGLELSLHTHSEYVAFIACQRQQLLREGDSMLRDTYVYISCLLITSWIFFL
jgi:hypothetical protein